MAVSSEYLGSDGQSLLYRVNRNGLSTHLCGAPVLMVSAGDVVHMMELDGTNFFGSFEHMLLAFSRVTAMQHTK